MRSFPFSFPLTWGRWFVLGLVLMGVLARCGPRMRDESSPTPPTPPKVATVPPGADAWSLHLGGEGSEEMEGLWVLPDGGMVISGSSDSFRDPAGEAWVVRLDREGHILWQKTYGGPGDESLLDVHPTADGGFVAVGYTESFGAGGQDVWVVKLDAAGDIRWQKTYGGPRDEQAWSVDVSPEGDLLVAGGTASFGAGKTDYWVLKLTPEGGVRWAKTYGGPEEDGGGGDYDERVVKALVDREGRYLVASVSSSFGEDEEDTDLWVLRLAPDGRVLWQQAFGGVYEEEMFGFALLANGDVLLPGHTDSFSPDLSGDVWVVRLRLDGTVVWQKVYALPQVWVGALAATGTQDNGAVIAAYVEEEDDWDWLLFRLDAEGNLGWQTRFEGGWDWPNAVRPLSEGGFAVIGVSWSQPPDGPFDLWVSRLTAEGSPGVDCGFVRPLRLRAFPSAMTPRQTRAVVMDTPVRPQESQAVVVDTAAHSVLLCSGEAR